MYRWFIRMANRTPFEDNKGRQLVTTAFGIEKESSTRAFALLNFKTPATEKFGKSRQNSVEMRQIINDSRSH